MRKAVHLAAVAACLLAALVPVRAQRYPVRIYEEVDGLPSSNVYGIHQDDEGVIWFATRAGVAHYDGSDWVAFHSSEGLTENDTFGILDDGTGRLWTAPSRTPARPAWFDGTRWVSVGWPETPDDESLVYAFAARTVAGGPRIALGTDAGRVVVWNGRDWHARQVTRSEWGVRSLVGVDGGFLVAVPDGVAFLDDDPEVPPRWLRGLEGRPVSGMGRDAISGRIWVIGADRIGYVDDNGLIEVASGLDLPFEPAPGGMAVAADRYGGLYFGSPEQLMYYHRSTGLIETLGTASGLVAEGARAILVDREDNVWIAGMRGVTKLVTRRFAGYDRAHGLLADEVSAVLELRGGGMLLGHQGGVTFLDDRVRPVRLVDNQVNFRISDLAEADDGTIWAAAAWGGLISLDRQGHMQRHEIAEPARILMSVLLDRHGRLWLGTDRGLQRREGSTVRKISLASSRSAGAPSVRRVFEDRDGAIWVATAGDGVFRLQGDRVDQLRFPGSELQLGNSTFAVLQTPDGEHWVGSEGGLFRVGDTELEKVEHPRVDRPIYFITEGYEGRIWLGTDSGVRRWDGEHLESFTARSDLLGSETNRAAGVLDTRGRMWIGTNRGVSVHDPEFDLPRRSPPTVDLLHVETAGARHPLDRPVEVEKARSGIAFRFRAIAFVDEARIRFRYRLEGFDADWIGPVGLPGRELRYTNLPTGEYRLHLQVLDAANRPSDEVVSPAVVVLGPFWQRPSSIVAFIALAVMLIYAGVSLRAHRRYTRKLAREVRERTRDLRESERATAAEKVRLAATLAGIREGVVATDDAGRIALWNPCAERIVGISEDQALGRLLDDLVPGLREAGQREGTFLWKDRRGDERTIEVSAASIHGEAEIAGTVHAFRDVTERQRFEAEMEKARHLESLGVLAGGIAHDFNNLLMDILGSLSLIEIERIELDAEVQGNLDAARSATLRARGLTRQLQTFASGGAPVRKAASIGEVVREMATFASRGSHVLFDVELAEDLHVVEIDPAQIGQVLHNLLMNARQAMPEGGTIRIRGSNSRTPPPILPAGRWVHLEIEDEGPGIAEDALPLIFDPYYTTKVGGIGMGLASAYSIVKRHDGLLSAESPPGAGARFHVWLPASDRPAVPHPEPVTAVPPGRARILVMDDEERVRAVIARILSRNGYTADVTGNGADALLRYTESRDTGKPYDLVIADLTVAGAMGGKELLERLREIDPDVRAVAVTGYSTDPVLARPTEFGFTAALGKPFEARELTHLLARVLSRLPREETANEVPPPRLRKNRLPADRRNRAGS